MFKPDVLPTEKSSKGHYFIGLVNHAVFLTFLWADGVTPPHPPVVTALLGVKAQTTYYINFFASEGRKRHF